MHIDIPTLNLLTIGTLCVSLAMTLWERSANPRRASELGIWAAGYAMLAIGCVLMMARHHFPGATGSAATNIVMLLGYLTVLHGAASLDGRSLPRFSILLLTAAAAAWMALGARFPVAFWNHVSSLPITVICGATAWMIYRSAMARGLRSRGLAVAIIGGHGAFYLFRAILMPFVAAVYGSEALVLTATLTMFEAVLYAFAMPMALLALVREEAQGRLLAASRTDYLTGLGNRHALFERSERIFATEGTDRPIALLAFDLDHFKTINDRHGHATGDEVLKLFANVARRTLGPDAVLARLGGEEFAALLPGMDAEAARRIGETVCRQFETEPVRCAKDALRATVSVGVAVADSPDQDLSKLLLTADRALYRAKALGRNRVETAARDGVAVAA